MVRLNRGFQISLSRRYVPCSNKAYVLKVLIKHISCTNHLVHPAACGIMDSTTDQEYIHFLWKIASEGISLRHKALTSVFLGKPERRIGVGAKQLDSGAEQKAMTFQPYNLPERHAGSSCTAESCGFWMLHL